MDSKRFALATLVGGLVVWGVGHLIFTMAFGGFYDANAGSATGVDRAEQIQWAVALGSLAYAALITYALGRRNAAFSLSEGAQVGAIVGFLLWFTVDFIFYGSTNLMNLTRTIVDPLLEIVRGGISGAVIAIVLRRVPAPAVAPA
jgi:hypothetical protein